MSKKHRPKLRFILGDQLSRDIAALRDAEPATDILLLAEVGTETDYVPHHPKKIAFLFSAMRHFAEEMRAEGFTVDYVTLDDTANTQSFAGEVQRAVQRHKAAEVITTFPGEFRVLDDMQGWEQACGVPVEIREDDRFFCPTARFRGWADGKRQLRMEFFYRDMRRETGLLMDEGEPVGGQWNFDADNRKPLPARIHLPPDFFVKPDRITEDVLALVATRFGRNFGSLDGFDYAVTRKDALRALAHFISHALPSFGDYQDAMRQGEDRLFHSLLSPYLNAGLLGAREVCAAAETAYRDGQAPLNAVEGFIRQILGWREYVRGIYWLKMPDYAESNTLDAQRPLPWLYWGGETAMNCMAQCVDQTRRLAHAHHIQRLMVLGNFALLIGARPKEVAEWYLAVYLDAYEWVELPNVHGMVLHADGGYLGSKPYAASGKYIDRMSDYCRHCRYDVKTVVGDKACPFNFLYWNFLIKNEKRLGANQRMSLIYASLGRMDAAKRAAVTSQAKDFLNAL
ncbi:cryptochrome/photolyase family protein [Acidisoma silvae]|uniref:Cryptochrome/photolyase family protein n=2 Tax=Acidisoma silvae TaxID=2802396 RepID=A0A963YSQ5_9PROT|nr:cryptochrome/photolyase family protein [Acidisoma silvae]